MVKPETPPKVTWACDDRCRSELGPDSILNLTCTSDEAKPAVTLTWLTDKGTPIEAETSDIRKGSILRGTFVTNSTIRYSVKRNITLTCQAENDVIGRRKAEQGTDVKLYETVTPSAPPDITSSCVDHCQSGLPIGTQLNLTCTSGEAKPPVKLKWLDSQGMLIEPLYSDVEMGSMTGAFVTTSTVQFNFTVNTSLICRAETVEGTRVGPLMTRIELNEDGIGAVGDAAVGKSALTQVFHSDGSHYPKGYSMTIGQEICVKTVSIPDTSDTVELYIYDSAGKEMFADYAAQFWDNPSALMVVFDVNNEKSFHSCMKWSERVKNKATQHIPGVVVGNKIDLVDRRVVTEEAARSFAQSNRLEYFECSAKNQENVEAPFKFLAEEFHKLYYEKLEVMKAVSG